MESEHSHLALSMGGKILEAERRRFNQSSDGKLRALIFMARLSKDAGCYEDAEVYYAEALRLKEIAVTTPTAVAQDLRDYAQVLRKLGRDGEAQKIVAGGISLPIPNTENQKYLSKVKPIFDVAEQLEKDGHLKQAQDLFVKGMERTQV